MAILVFANHEEGTLSRYEVGGESARKTHYYAHGAPAVFEWDVVQGFRTNPDDKWKLDPDPEPTPPNAGAGTGGAANDEDSVVDAVAEQRVA